MINGQDVLRNGSAKSGGSLSPLEKPRWSPSNEGAVRPVVSFNPNWDKIFTGESLSLTCNVDSVGREDQKYIWYKDDKLLPTGLKQFLIKSAETKDSGKYQCQTATSDISDAVKLDVTYDWIILQVPQSVYEGDDVSLRCHRNQGDHTGGTIIFYNKENPVIQKSEIDLIFFKNVSMSMVGEYQCAAGSATYYSAKGTLNVRELFSNPLVNVSQYPVTEGANVTVTCDTALSPHRAATELQFAFYRNGQNVQEFGFSNKYQIQSVQLQDTGDYTCQVKTATDTVRKESIARHVQIQAFASSHSSFVIHYYGTNCATRTTIFREPFSETFHNVIAIRSGTICTFW
ncbi:high affinity immunoglobulin gamma Fc receptor I-like [Pelobates cultripes]|nr:high affinity immunoglobulin gamma Fc receptor I-like [Pelobates cultripes]